MSHTTDPWESRPIGSKGDIGIYVLNAPPSCGVIARIPYTATQRRDGYSAGSSVILRCKMPSLQMRSVPMGW